MRKFFYNFKHLVIYCDLSENDNLYWSAKEGDEVISDGWTKLPFDVMDTKNNDKLDKYFEQNVNKDLR
jgi:hypothetical protein